MSAPAFVLCWSASEPDRVGEVAHLVPGDHRIRDDDARTDAAPLLFAAERPGVAAEGRPLHGRRTSTWLSISAGMFGVRIRVADGHVTVNGSRLPRGQWRELAPGDTVYLRDDLLLFFALRPNVDALVHFPRRAFGPFGKPDALGILGESGVVWRWREAIAAIAATGENVLIDGEIGTGKELTAGGIHALSARSSGPLWRGVIGSEWEVPFWFYGHAENFRDLPEPEREGLLGGVHGGTLFVDHVQYCSGRERALAALDEVLERGGEYRRVGDPRPRISKFVLLAATNTNPDDVHPLLRKHARGRITTPTLAEHREDIPLLMRMLLGRQLEKAGPEADAAFWTEYVRVCSQPQVIERLVRGDYRNGGLFDLGRRMSDEVWNAKDLPSRRAR